MIDQSPPGSWAAILPYCTQITILDDYEAELERRLAARKRLRPIRQQAALKGWERRRNKA